MSKKNNQLPTLRLDSELLKEMNDLIDSLNTNSPGIKITLPQFRRLAYKDFVVRIRSEGLDLRFKPDS